MSNRHVLNQHLRDMDNRIMAEFDKVFNSLHFKTPEDIRKAQARAARTDKRRRE